MIRRILIAAALCIAASAPAYPQAGQFPAGTVEGNASAAKRQGQPEAVAAILDRALGTTRGAIIERGASGWGLIGPGTTGLPFVSNGVGADPAYQVLGVAGGGTNCAAASGTCLDNVTGFAANGYLKRTWAGAYSLVAAIPFSDLAITPTRAGDIIYWNGSAWVTLAGNNSGTNFLQETPGGVPSWVAAPGTGTVTSVTCFGVAITTSGTCITTGQLPGIATNTAASAGNVGEVINSCILVGSEVSLTSGTAANVTSISVTAGDWDIWGMINYDIAGTTSITALSASISDVTAALPTPPNVTTNFPDGGGMDFVRFSAFVPGSSTANGYPTGAVRALLSGTTTIFLVAFSNFTVSTNKAFGCITARRRR